MDKETRDALEGSIEKWEKLAVKVGDGMDRGIADCPLCGLYNASGCSSCPVYQRTGKSGCDGTPYADWGGHQAEVHGKSYVPRWTMCSDCITIAKSMVDFLKSLRPPVGGKEDKMRTLVLTDGDGGKVLRVREGQLMEFKRGDEIKQEDGRYSGLITSNLLNGRGVLLPHRGVGWEIVKCGPDTYLVGIKRDTP